MMIDMQHSVLQFLHNSEETSAVVSEAATSVNSQFSVEGIVTSLKSAAVAQGSRVSSVTASFCANQCIDILNSTKEGILNNKHQKLLDIIIDVIKRVQTENGFSEVVFLRTLASKVDFPIEFLWKMNNAAVLSFESFFSGGYVQHSSPDRMAKQVVELCSEVNSVDPVLQRTIVKDTMAFLINQGYSDTISDDAKQKGIRKIASNLLDSICKEVVNEDQLCGHNLYEIVQGVVGSEIDLIVWKRFCVRQIQNLLTSSVETRAEDTTMEFHLKCTFGTTPKHITSIYMQLMLAFEATEVAHELRTLVQDRKDISWLTTLRFTATFLVCFPEAPKLIRSIIRDVLNEAMESCEHAQILVSFLLARQACLEGQHVFHSYAEWFHVTFGDANSPANNRKSFAFFTKFLTDIMPLESASHLKIHLLKPPFVPQKCQQLLTDYVMLAKTRLADLNDPIDQLGIYTDIDDTVKAGEQADVEKALESFEKSGKVPASIMEASIFRKPYYLGRFLPALLKPRPLPDVTDTRMKFIDSLKKSDKIPPGLYSHYEKECRRESKLLLDGVFSDGEDDMDDMLLTPMQLLEKALDHLMEMVLQSHTKRESYSGVLGQISFMSEKVHNILDTQPADPDQSVIVDLDASGIDKKKLQVITSILTTVSKLLTGLGSYSTDGDNSWLTQLLAKLTEHPHMIASIVAVIRGQIMNRRDKLQAHHLEAIAAILLHFISLPSIFGAIFIKGNERKVTLEEDLEWLLVCRSKDDMIFSLGFSTFYLKYALMKFDKFALHYNDGQTAVIPPGIVKKFGYLVQRNLSSVTLGNDSLPFSGEDARFPCERISVQIYRSDDFQKLLSDSKFTLDEWLNWESIMNPMEDILSDENRQTYHTWAVEEVFLFRDVEEGGCAGSYKMACAKIAMEIITCDSRMHTMDGCQHKKFPGGTKPYSNKQSLIILLQSLANYLHCVECGANESDSSTKPWSHMALNTIYEKSNVIERNLLLTSILRLFRLLHPSIFFVDNPREPLENSALQRSFHFVDSLLRNHTFASLSIDYQMCVHFIKGLNILSSHHDRDVKSLLTNCAPLTAACLVHWKLIKEQRKKLTNRAVKDFLSNLENICENPIRRIMNGEDTWQVGLAWYIQLVRPRLNENPSLPPNIKKNSVVLRTFFTILLVELLQLLIIGASDQDKYRHAQRLAVQVLLSGLVSTEVFTTCEQGAFAQTIPDYIRRLLPVGASKMILDLHSSGEQTLVARDRSSYLGTLLTLHVKCVRLHEECNDNSQLDGKPVDCSVHIEPLTVNFLQKITSKIRQIARRSDRSLLQSHNFKDILKDCDPEVRKLFS